MADVMVAPLLPTTTSHARMYPQAGIIVLESCTRMYPQAGIIVFQSCTRVTDCTVHFVNIPVGLLYN